MKKYLGEVFSGQIADLTFETLEVLSECFCVINQEEIMISVGGDPNFKTQFRLTLCNLPSTVNC